MVSIVVPVYKVKEYLPACIESILGQTYRDIQLILVDDGSPDDCGVICDAYAKKDSRVLSLHKPNGGVSSARNYGLDYVRGEYVTFCDSDDAYCENWIERLVAAMEKHHADVVVGGYVCLTESGLTGEQISRKEELLRTDTQSAKIEYCFSMVMSDRHGWEIWDRLFRTDIIQGQQIRFCETCGNYAEDLAFVLSYSLYTDRIAAIDVCGYQYRIREGSMMQNSLRIPKLGLMDAVYDSFASQCGRKLDSSLAEAVLPGFYFQMIAGQFIPKVWSAGSDPEQIREAAIAGVKNWPEMECRLRNHMEQRLAWNPCYSGSYNAEVICHVRFLLDGSWQKLRIQCRLIRIFKPVLDWYGKQIAKRLMWK